ncbi:MAG TPA: hypothetical protein VE983_03530 [Solirubrobacteraceae bacterium]|nr:hypothetical protein [Solirubrobacteraceae bacterium]
MSTSRDAKVQQILELFKAGDYRVDPAVVAGSVIRRLAVPPASGPGPTAACVGHPAVRRRGIVSVDRGRARVAAF